ncbi:hypothetical protein [Curtobacterium sp. 9128]|uniref:hypothetical protein n=1 Tax=Curtobacterium sp. 9128 TaxID=1793722 RepID=UPI0011A30796|nr:hypothetical protein [Curtobacterium sp. 9128]
MSGVQPTANTTDVNPLRTIGRWMRDSPWLHPTLTYSGTVILGVGGLVKSAEPAWENWTGSYIAAFIVGTATTLTGFVLGRLAARQQAKLGEDLIAVRKKNQQLLSDNDVLTQVVEDAKNITDEVMRSAATAHGLAAEDRVTVYRLDAGELAVVCRWSGNQVYRTISEETRERRYDFDFGLIGLVAQTNRRISVDGAPPQKNRQQYNGWHRVHGGGLIGREVEGLGMKSRCYDVVPLTDDRNEPVGVVAVESTEAKSPAISHLGDEIELKGGTAAALRGLIALNNPIEARPDDDEEEVTT